MHLVQRSGPAPLSRDGGPPPLGADGLVVAPSQPAVGVMLVRLEGELDLVTAPRMGAVLGSAIEAVATETARSDAEDTAWSGRVVCDLDGLAFMSVSALHRLVEVSRAAAERGVELVLVASCRPVRRVLELTDLDGSFWIVPDLDAAPAAAS